MDILSGAKDFIVRIIAANKNPKVLFKTVISILLSVGCAWGLFLLQEYITIRGIEVGAHSDTQSQLVMELFKSYKEDHNRSEDSVQHKGKFLKELNFLVKTGFIRGLNEELIDVAAKKYIQDIGSNNNNGSRRLRNFEDFLRKQGIDIPDFSSKRLFDIQAFIKNTSESMFFHGIDFHITLPRYKLDIVTAICERNVTLNILMANMSENNPNVRYIAQMNSRAVWEQREKTQEAIAGFQAISDMIVKNCPDKQNFLKLAYYDDVPSSRYYVFDEQEFYQVQYLYGISKEGFISGQLFDDKNYIQDIIVRSFQKKMKIAKEDSDSEVRNINPLSIAQ